jgi:hypothetical protein
MIHGAIVDVAIYCKTQSRFSLWRIVRTLDVCTSRSSCCSGWSPASEKVPLSDFGYGDTVFSQVHGYPRFGMLDHVFSTYL